MSEVENTKVKPASRRRGLRLILLVVVPLVAAVAGVGFYLQGGRYISTDNAYVGAQKVLVTPEISGTIDSISVTEGQYLKVGDVLFTIDRKPYEIALAEANAALVKATNDFTALKDRYKGLSAQIELAQQTQSLRQAEVKRKSELLSSKVVARSDVDVDRINLQEAQTALEVLQQNQRDIVNQLGGNAEAPLESYAPYLSARAAVDKAQWNLDRTVMRAPMEGVATQVTNIQMGRFLAAGTTVFAIVSNDDLWVDANPKETDITYLLAGQEATVTVDAYPGEPLKGRVASISPGTGAQFSLIPAQNAAGNWVKVVQRVPVRIDFLPGQDLSKLRAGMSSTVDIDTHRSRSLAGLLGLTAEAQTAMK